MRRPRSSRVWLLVSFSVLLAANVSAQESTDEDAPAPKSVEDMKGAYGRSFEEEEYEPSAYPALKRKLGDLPPFLSDTVLRLQPRTYYFDQDRVTGLRSRAWAIGGALSYRSGWWRDTLAIGASLYTSQRIVGDKDEGGTLLLKPVQQGFTVVGQLYAKLKYGDHSLQLFRRTIDLPYVNKQDNRMVPNTFEAYGLDGKFKDVRGLRQLDYAAGWVARMKRRNDDEFISMSEAAGVLTGEDRGMFTAAVRAGDVEKFLAGAVNHWVPDVINITYLELDYMPLWSRRVAAGVRGGFQFTYQTSVGDKLLPGGAFNSWVASWRLAASLKGAIATLALSTTDRGAAIRSPFGSYPGYISLMQTNFNRAGEDALRVGLSYNFAEIGVEGLSGFMNLAAGRNARDADTGATLPDQNTLDVTGDYRFRTQRFGGFWLRVRFSLLDVEGADRNSYNVRVILNHDLPLL